MNTNILSVRFFVKKYKAKDNCAPIYVRIKVDRKSVDVSLKREIALDSWSPEKGQAKGLRPEIKALNAFLDHVRADVTNAYNQVKFEGKSLRADTVKNKFCGIEPQQQTLLGLITHHNNHLKEFLEWGTMKNYATTQKYIQMFLNQQMKVTDVPLSQLSYSFLVDFELFLKDHKPLDHHKPCGHNAVLKHIERLRKMINLAIKNEWLERDPFAKFQVRFIRNDREFLTQEELTAIEAKETKILRLQWGQGFVCIQLLHRVGILRCDELDTI
jgi:hypothetical protein